MNGLWTINGIDLYDAFGAYILKGSYNDLLSPPMPRKRLEHEYIDQDGVAVDTTSPLTYEARRFTLRVALKGISSTQFWSRYNAFFGLVSTPGSFLLYVADLGKTFTLLYEGTAKAEKLTPIATASQVYAVFEVKVLEPLTATIAAPAPNTIVSTEAGTYVYTAGQTPFEFIDNELFLNI